MPVAAAARPELPTNIGSASISPMIPSAKTLNAERPAIRRGASVS